MWATSERRNALAPSQILHKRTSQEGKRAPAAGPQGKAARGVARGWVPGMGILERENVSHLLVSESTKPVAKGLFHPLSWPFLPLCHLAGVGVSGWE